MNKLKVFAIELTNWCNAKCSFCPYPLPEHNREKGYMTMNTLQRLIEVTEPGGVNLSGLGEPLLHPMIIPYVSLLIDNGFKVQLNTNGQRLNQLTYNNLVDAGLHNIVITADYFKWNKQAIAEKEQCPITMLTITREPDRPELGQKRKPLDDWGKQVGNVDRPKVRCSYLHDDFVDIMWDGRIKRCHVDFNGNHSFGSIFVDTDVAACRRSSKVVLEREISLCKNCSGYIFEDGIVSGDYDGDGLNLVELKV